MRCPIRVAARSLSTTMRVCCGIGEPRGLKGLRALLKIASSHRDRRMPAMDRLVAALVVFMAQWPRIIGGMIRQKVTQRPT